MNRSTQEERVDLGVLFVDGIGQQRPGRTVASFAAALYGWLFRWNCNKQLSPASPELSETVLAPDLSVDADPAHATLTTKLHMGNGERDVRWLLAESWWADVFAPPRFLDLTRWVWKVSTCLLVLQFVIPMRRHWREVKEDAAGRRPPSWLLHLLVVAGYAILMGVAAMLSVLLSGMLLVLALAAKLPIPRIDRAVQWVVVKLSAVLGDSYVLAHCPVQYAAMRTQVAHDLAWLEARCDKVVIVAHSQGAAIAHQVLKDDASSRQQLRAFITLGQGISKLHLLRRMDWDPQASRAAFWTRLFVTGGLFCAGLPALGTLLSRWINATILELPARFPANLALIVAGFVAILLGVVHAIRVVGDEIEHDLLLPGAGTQFSWIDYYASADPVSNGPLMARSAAGSPVDPPGVQDHARDPRPCDEIYNSGSILTDHNGYLRNQDQLLSKLINNLVAVTFADPNGDAAGPRLVRDEDVTEAKRRRHRLVALLVGGRMLAATVGVVLWWFNPGPLLKDPMNSLVHLVAPHTGMGDRLARLIAAAILMALFYIVVVLLWRILERRSISHFFHTAKRGWQPHEAPEPSMPRDHTTQTTAATTVG